ncbi:MAG: cytochrome c [Calditrichaeota bacterium]|nr:MAG: cytochrome c [Calditrichota bacterium]MBL1203911.1 cytochrome c [Calditrichota bacterium]NOG43744.1 cytochrome c [Calditrichota bacterium]
MDKIRRWAPFVTLLIIACFSFIYFILLGDNEPYFPTTDNPELIYQEACVQCHGKKGQGSGILYPSFDHSQLDIKKIERAILEGDWLMPRFENIKGDTLKNLSEYIYSKKYLK